MELGKIKIPKTSLNKITESGSSATKKAWKKPKDFFTKRYTSTTEEAGKQTTHVNKQKILRDGALALLLPLAGLTYRQIAADKAEQDLWLE